jgi:hypothetical protein
MVDAVWSASPVTASVVVATALMYTLEPTAYAVGVKADMETPVEATSKECTLPSYSAST